VTRTASFFAALVVIAIVTAAAPARADREDKAQKLFESATSLFQKGDYDRAAQRFMRAFKLVPHPNTAFNAALSWDAASDDARAANAFKLALDSGLARQARERAEGRLDELEEKLGRVRVHAPAGSRVLVSDETRRAPAEIYVEPGIHDVVVLLPDGKRRVHRIHAHAGDTSHVSVAGGTGGDESSSNTLRTVGWGSIVTAAVLGAVSIGLEARAAKLRSDFNTSDRTDASLRTVVLHAQTWATVGWVATGVAGVTGIALVVGSPSGPDTRVSIVPGGVSLSRTF